MHFVQPTHDVAINNRQSLVSEHFQNLKVTCIRVVASSVAMPTLVFARSPMKGMMALEIPMGAILDLHPPIDVGQFEAFDISDDREKMKELMNKDMEPRDIRDLLSRLGVQPENMPSKKTRKPELVSRTIDAFQISRAIFETGYVNPRVRNEEASSGDDTRLASVILNEGMTQDEIILEVCRQVPDLASAPRSAIERFVEEATRYHVSSSAPNPTSTTSSAPSPPTTTKPFSGQGHKLSADVAKTDKGGYVSEYEKNHVKPEMEVRMLPYENAPKDTYKTDQSNRDFYEVELTDKTSKTKGKAIITLECEKSNFRFIFYYTEGDTIKDIMDLLEMNSNFKREQMSIYYKDGNSFQRGWEFLLQECRQ